MHTGGEGGGGGHLMYPLKRLLKWLCIFGRDLTKQTLGTKIFSSTFSNISLLLYRAGVPICETKEVGKGMPIFSPFYTQKTSDIL